MARDAAQSAHMQEYGLTAYEGGRHQGWGTENWLVPLGEAYLELAAVFDDEVAEKCDWGRYITDQASMQSMQLVSV